MEEKKYIVFMDAVSRTIIGEEVGVEGKFISVKNPTIINVVPIPSEDPTGDPKMSIQLIPVFFRELLKKKNEPAVFSYNSENITISNIDELEDHVIQNYESLYRPLGVQPEVEKADGGEDDKAEG